MLLGTRVKVKKKTVRFHTLPMKLTEVLERWLVALKPDNLKPEAVLFVFNLTASVL